MTRVVSTRVVLPRVVLTGAAAVILDPTEKTMDPSAFLKVRKTRKFMGTQDDLAVVAVGRALANASLSHGARQQDGEARPTGVVRPDGGLRPAGPAEDQARLAEFGLYAAVGFIPFEGADIAAVLAASLTDGAFDGRRFNAEGYVRAHPLLTFRCLPNMPAFHVSANFGVEGPIS